MANRNSRIAAPLEFATAWAVMTALRVLPKGSAHRFARLCTCVLDRAIPKLRRTARINLSFAFPDLSPAERDKTIDGVFESIARLLVSFAKFPDINKCNVGDWIRYEGLEHYRAAKAKGKGVLVATAHLGNWELSAFAHALLTEPMGVIVRPLDNPLADNLVERRRGLSGNKLILKKDSALSVVRALKNNEAIGILIDQNTTADEGVFINFFGKEACTGVAFAKLAARTGAAVVPGFAFWEKAERRYVLRFFPEIKITGDARSDTQRIHSEFEKLIRAYPEQWLWIHRRWKTRPTGEAEIY